LQHAVSIATVCSVRCANQGMVKIGRAPGSFLKRLALHRFKLQRASGSLQDLARCLDLVSGVSAVEGQFRGRHCSQVAARPSVAGLGKITGRGRNYISARLSHKFDDTALSLDPLLLERALLGLGNL